jgi:hypothetical protein
MNKPWTKRCPKCAGYLYQGGVRFGMPARDIVSCANCGLTNESSRYLDAATGAYREIDGAIEDRTRHHHIGGVE